MEAERMRKGCGKDAERMRKGCGKDAERMRKGCGYFGREIVSPPNPADWFYFHQGAGHRE